VRYFRQEGIGFVGITRGAITLSSMATISVRGNYVKTADSYKTATATIDAAGSLIHPAASDMAADAVTVIVGSFIRSGNNDQTGSAFIDAAASVEYVGAIDMTATANISVVSGIVVPAETGMAANATVSAIGQSKTFVSGVASLTADATVVAASVITMVASAALASDATITATGSTGPPLAVTLTDSVNLGVAGAPYNLDWDGEGMTTSTTGGTPPYTYTVTVNQWRHSGGGWTAGCNIDDDESSTLTVAGEETTIGNGITCSGSESALTSVALVLVNTAASPYPGEANVECDVTLTVTDANSAEATADAICRYNLAY